MGQFSPTEIFAIQIYTFFGHELTLHWDGEMNIKLS